MISNWNLTMGIKRTHLYFEQKMPLVSWGCDKKKGIHTAIVSFTICLTKTFLGGHLTGLMGRNLRNGLTEGRESFEV